MAAVPEAFADLGDREYYLGDEPLSYPALGDARIWIEDHALEISGMARLHADVKRDHADAVTRFWDFVESQALAARDDTALRSWSRSNALKAWVGLRTSPSTSGRRRARCLWTRRNGCVDSMAKSDAGRRLAPNVSAEADADRRFPHAMGSDSPCREKYGIVEMRHVGRH